jgi:hypothetical protein
MSPLDGIAVSQNCHRYRGKGLAPPLLTCMTTCCYPQSEQVRDQHLRPGIYLGSLVQVEKGVSGAYGYYGTTDICAESN